jgi:ABC-2 type transport system ATP-binding protein
MADDVDLYSRSRRQLLPRIALMPQSFTFPRELSCLEFVEYLAWMRGMGSKTCRPAARRALEKVDLVDMGDRRMSDLSGGMVRRVGLAQALVAEPEVLLLDEPTTGLDPEQRVILRQIITGLRNEATVVISSHVMEDIESVATRVIVIHEGRALFQGDMDNFCQSVPVAENGSRAEAAFMNLLTDHRGRRR